MKTLHLGSHELLTYDWMVDEYQDMLDSLCTMLFLDDDWKFSIQKESPGILNRVPEDSYAIILDAHHHIDGVGNRMYRLNIKFWLDEDGPLQTIKGLRIHTWSYTNETTEAEKIKFFFDKHFKDFYDYYIGLVS